MKSFIPYLLIPIATIVFILFILRTYKIQNHLKSNGKLVNVKIESWMTPGKGMSAYNLRCEFEYKNKSYSLISTTSYKGNFDRIIGKFFPAFFLPSGDNIEVLITPEDFSKYQLNFPDSLKWVLK